jgi:hypothetical protein
MASERSDTAPQMHILVEILCWALLVCIYAAAPVAAMVGCMMEPGCWR